MPVKGTWGKVQQFLHLRRQQTPLQFHLLFFALCTYLIRKCSTWLASRKSCRSLPVIRVPTEVSRHVTPESPSPDAAIRSQVVAPRQFGEEQGELFELGSEIGVGGQGTVYSCTRVTNGYQYAAKVISLKSSRREKDKQRNLLRREINIMKQLHHVNIVNLHDAFWQDSFCIIVMDLLGGNLLEKIESEVNALGEAPFRGLGGAELASKYVLNQLTRGTKYMHQRNIIHRDLKLENVIIAGSFRHDADVQCELLDVKIADFGLSKKPVPARRRRNRLQSHMTAVGTPAYVAPEVLDEIYDERVDIWSLGVILYAMLCGSMPFEITSMNPDRHKMEVAQVYEGDSWEFVSEEGKCVVRGLLTVDADRRLSLIDCLRLPWVSSGALAAEAENEFDTPSTARRASQLSCEYNSDEDVYASESLQPQVQGVVKQINGSIDLDVHHIELLLRDGSNCAEGLAGAACTDSWSLMPDELIVAVVQHADGDHLGSGLVFLTSLCQVIAVQSSEARKGYRFVAPRGFQIMGLQFQNAQLVGIVVEKIRQGLGAVGQIGGRSGSAVDQVYLRLRDGSTLYYGDMSGGTETDPHHLKSNEFIFAVEQHFKDRGLGASIVFYTSAGNVIRLSGLCAAPSTRFAVPAGSQLCGLDFRNGRLKDIRICPENGDLDSARLWRNPSTAILSSLVQED